MVSLVAIIALASLLVAPSGTLAQDTVKVGVLKLTSSAPIFIGVERGFFKEFGVEPPSSTRRSSREIGRGRSTS
jgi:ABC-type nitrate/sulfonate/bicarbonate transport system substrate-binding protein